MKAETNFAKWLQSQFDKRPGMTAGMLAQQAGIPRPSAYSYWRGTRVPGEEALVKIATALGIERSSMPPFAAKK